MLVRMVAILPVGVEVYHSQLVAGEGASCMLLLSLKAHQLPQEEGGLSSIVAAAVLYDQVQEFPSLHPVCSDGVCFGWWRMVASRTEVRGSDEKKCNPRFVG